jgi:pimeloyl-ACP methyl ester carboxylesterase
MPKSTKRRPHHTMFLCHGEPLVLIHGWSCEGRYWREFKYLPSLSAEFTVIVPDSWPWQEHIPALRLQRCLLRRRRRRV